jgi:acyl-CoA synthetase (AMP-forming)/AMP-acid ligase II/acyl carrier protein
LTRTWTEVLTAWVEARPDAVLYQFLADGERVGEQLRYGELDQRARTVAARLRREGLRQGDRALLVFAPGLDFVAAFFGCVYAGVVAVPTYPPRPGGPLAAIERIAAHCGARAVLTSDWLVEVVQNIARGSPVLGRLGVVPCGGPLEPQGGSPVSAEPDSVVMLQYTSGSTGDPRGVVLDHANLLHNEALIARAFAHDAESVVLGWLPTHHDMGLIGNVLQPVFLGTRCVLMSPTHFLERPLRWLRAISAHGATTSGGPNFAYELCLRAYDRAQLEGVDLSGWAVAFNGAEPVRHATLSRFSATYAPHGFRSSAFLPCYGLAEATLIVSGGPAGTGARHLTLERQALEAGRVLPSEGGAQVVSCGPTCAEVAVVVDGARVGDDRVGELWVQGPSVGRGYFDRPEDTEAVFGATLPDLGGRWLRTGDLGFVRGGELFVTGRSKDLILYRGRNLYPQDLELAAERSHPALRAGCVAAFELEEPDEGVVVVAEIRDPSQAQEACLAIRRALAAEHELPLADVVIVPPKTLTKTTSGKLRRRPTRAEYQQTRLAVRLDPGPQEPSAGPPAGDLDPVVAATAEIFASVLGSPSVPLDEPFAALGGDSLRAATALARLEERYGVHLQRDQLEPFTVHRVARAVDDALVALLATLDDDEVARRLVQLERSP